MVTWKLAYTKQAQKDAKKLASSGLKSKAMALLTLIEESPYQNPPPYEKLVGDLAGAYSRRIISRNLTSQRTGDAFSLAGVASLLSIASSRFMERF